jgi:hypothetical protein
MLNDICHLTHEVQVLHSQCFGRAAPQELIKAYVKFHIESPKLVEATNEEIQTLVTVINKELDAFGIEPWLRGGPTRHLLSRKLLLISYLAECDAAHLESSQLLKGRWRILVQLFCNSVNGIGYLLKGRFQKALYGLL